MKYLITIEYSGHNYVGWQRQKNGISVQEVIENALEKLFGEKIQIAGSGRTDSGVHAYGQTAHFETQKTIPAEKLHLALNTYLPKDIVIKNAKVVDEDFHAQYMAKEKTYVYKIYVSQLPSPILEQTHARVYPKIDFALMQEGAKLLEGTHDFAAFSSAHRKVKSTVRTIYSIVLTQNAEFIEMRITGNGFLYNMVRIIAGTLVFLGKGKRSLADLEDALATGDRKKAGKTFPAHGLYLLNVVY